MATNGVAAMPAKAVEEAGPIDRNYCRGLTAHLAGSNAHQQLCKLQGYLPSVHVGSCIMHPKTRTRDHWRFLLISQPERLYPFNLLNGSVCGRRKTCAICTV